MNNAKEAIRKYVVDNFLFGDGGNLREDSSFLEDGIIDSTGILELVSFLETTYSISVKDEELVPENLDSINNILSYLHTKAIA